MKKIILTIFILPMMFINSYGKNDKWLTPYSNLKTDKQRITMIEKIHNDETGSMTYEEQFKNILMLILDLRETDFTLIDHGGVFRSTKHWNSYMWKYIIIFFSPNHKDYIKKWSKGEYGFKLLEFLKKLGYYGKDITTVKRKKIKDKHKILILNYAMRLYDEAEKEK